MKTVPSFFEPAGKGYSFPVRPSRIELFGNGILDLSMRNPPGTAIGSLEGDGGVGLGGDNLTIGNNNLTTTFSGIIADGGASGGAGGSITKIGTGSLVLSGVSSYTGSTVVNSGKLIVDGLIISEVVVNAGGTLGGSGTTGSVSVNSGGKVAPGDPQTLTVDGSYQQASRARLALTITGTDPADFDQVVVTGNIVLSSGSVLELDFSAGFAPHTGDTFNLITFDSIVGTFNTIEIVGLEPGFEYSVAPDGSGHLRLTALNDGLPIPTPTSANLVNISTRMEVLTDDKVLIAGFIITGNAPKQVILRAIGPALADFNLDGVLADPVLELHEPGGITLTNDNWKEAQQAEIEATGFAPGKDAESAIVATLAPGSYTAIVKGKNGGTGIGLVDAYDLDAAEDSTLGNLSTRGFVDTGDNAMIAGVTVGGGSSQILVRALGVELIPFGVTDPLQDTVLELRNKNGGLITSNDDWKETQQAAIEATGYAPTDDGESAILMTLAPDSYTAIVRGKDDTTGVALVEAYNVSP